MRATHIRHMPSKLSWVSLGHLRFMDNSSTQVLPGFNKASAASGATEAPRAPAEGLQHHRGGGRKSSSRRRANGSRLCRQKLRQRWLLPVTSQGRSIRTSSKYPANTGGDTNLFVTKTAVNPNDPGVKAPFSRTPFGTLKRRNSPEVFSVARMRRPLRTLPPDPEGIRASRDHGIPSGRDRESPVIESGTFNHERNQTGAEGRFPAEDPAAISTHSAPLRRTSQGNSAVTRRHASWQKISEEESPVRFTGTWDCGKQKADGRLKADRPLPRAENPHPGRGKQSLLPKDQVGAAGIRRSPHL